MRFLKQWLGMDGSYEVAKAITGFNKAVVKLDRAAELLIQEEAKETQRVADLWAHISEVNATRERGVRIAEKLRELVA